MFAERTSVGLDVHALSVRAAGLDTVTGQLVHETLTPSTDHVRDWLRRLPQPVAIYEAGPAQTVHESAAGRLRRSRRGDIERQHHWPLRCCPSTGRLGARPARPVAGAHQGGAPPGPSNRTPTHDSL